MRLQGMGNIHNSLSELDYIDADYHYEEPGLNGNEPVVVDSTEVPYDGEDAVKRAIQAVKAVETERKRAVAKGRCHEDSLDGIDVSGAWAHRILSDMAVASLERHNRGREFLYQRDGRLVQLQDKGGVSYDGKPTQETVIAEVTTYALTGMLTNSANFINNKGKHITPPIDIVHNVLAMGAWRFPVIVGVVSVPTIRPDGTILNRVGYDKATNLVYRPSEDFELPEIPEEPTEEDVQEAVRLIEEAIGEFPYDSQASKANAFAGMLTPIVRPAIGGRVPIEYIDATKIGSGKSLLMNTQVYIATGQNAATDTPPTDEAEWRKTILAAVRSGSEIHVFDDVHAKLDSGALQAAITQDKVGGRILGLSENTKLTNRGIWIATGNNLTVSTDMSRRGY